MIGSVYCNDCWIEEEMSEEKVEDMEVMIGSVYCNDCWIEEEMYREGKMDGSGDVRF